MGYLHYWLEEPVFVLSFPSSIVWQVDFVFDWDLLVDLRSDCYWSERYCFGCGYSVCCCDFVSGVAAEWGGVETQHGSDWRVGWLDSGYVVESGLPADWGDHEWYDYYHDHESPG